MESYPYGFNGKENDPESGTQDYGMRIYNPSLGKFLSVDPLATDFPWYTPYQFAGNKPIWATDLDGAEENKSTTKNTQTGPLLELSNVAIIKSQIADEIAKGLAKDFISRNKYVSSPNAQFPMINDETAIKIAYDIIRPNIKVEGKFTEEWVSVNKKGIVGRDLTIFPTGYNQQQEDNSRKEKFENATLGVIQFAVDKGFGVLVPTKEDDVKDVYSNVLLMFLGDKWAGVIGSVISPSDVGKGDTYTDQFKENIKGVKNQAEQYVKDLFNGKFKFTIVPTESKEKTETKEKTESKDTTKESKPLSNKKQIKG